MGFSHTFSVNGQLIKIYEFSETFIKMWNFIKGVNPPIKKKLKIELYAIVNMSLLKG